MEPEAPQLGRRRRAQRLPGRRGVKAVERRRHRADDPPFDLASLPRGDQLAAERPQQRVRDGGDADWPQAGQMARRATEERIAAEAEQELRVVVVDSEAEAQLLQRPLGCRRRRARDRPETAARTRARACRPPRASPRRRRRGTFASRHLRAAPRATACTGRPAARWLRPSANLRRTLCRCPGTT